MLPQKIHFIYKDGKSKDRKGAKEAELKSNQKYTYVC